MGAYAQVEKPDSVAAPVRADTVRVDSATAAATRMDTIKADTLALAPVSAVKDTAPRFRWIPPVFRAQHTPPFDPKIAWKRALLFPGGGQLYNRSYWKVPIVYAGLGGLVFWIWYNNVYYQSFNTSYITKYNGGQVLSIKVPFGETSVERLTANDFLNARDASRKSRDQAVLFLLGAYGLSAVEAYVDAHLKNFDVSEDLSLHISPGMIPTSTAFSSAFTATPGIRIVLKSSRGEGARPRAQANGLNLVP